MNIPPPPPQKPETLWIRKNSFLRVLTRSIASLLIACGCFATNAPAATANVSATWTVSAWSGGYTAYLTVKNNGSTPITGWTAQFTTPQQETSVWNATVTGPVANVYTVTPASWNSTLGANGGTATIGFTFNGAPPQTPTNFRFNGQSVTLNGPSPTPTPNPTATPIPSPTATPVPTPTATPVPTATPTPIPTATPAPTATPTPTATPKPTATPSPKPTATPSPTPTATPAPTATPSPSPSPSPTPVNGGGHHLTGYFPSWSDSWYSYTTDAQLLSTSKLAQVSTTSYTDVYLAFATPGFEWSGLAGNTWSGTGLDFTATPQDVTQAIRLLHNAGQRVVLSVGGATYTTGWNSLAAEAGQAIGTATAPIKTALAQFLVDMKIDGLDVDYEISGADSAIISQYAQDIQAMREAVDAAIATDNRPRILAVAGWSTGADYTAQAPNPANPNQISYWGGSAGRERLTFATQVSSGAYAGQRVGSLLNVLNVMSYDAGYQHYDPVLAYDEYRQMLPSSVAVSGGLEIPPESWGGAILIVNNADAGETGTVVLDDQYGNVLNVPYSVQRLGTHILANKVNTNTNDGLMVWDLLLTQSTQVTTAAGGTAITATPATIATEAVSLYGNATPTPTATPIPSPSPVPSASPTPTATPAPSATPVPSPSASPSASPSPSPSSGVSATWTVSAYSGGYTAYLTIQNNGSTTINGWSATLTTPQTETSVWNADVTGPVAEVYTLTPASWTSILGANGGSVVIGFTFNGAPPVTPTEFVFNGQTVSLNGGASSPSASPTPTPTPTPAPSATPVPSPTATPSPTPSPSPGSVVTSGQINFHYYYGTSPTSAQDSLILTGDYYTDLIMSNLIAGVMYGHLLKEFTPGIQFNADYLYGSIFAQLLQENIATEYYTNSTALIDPSAKQQAVMGAGQGGPYQINNYAVDMVAGSYAPAGYSLINYVAIQKNIGFTMVKAATQYEQITPASFNNKYYGPMVTAYFHFNDYRALQTIGGSTNSVNGETVYEPWSATNNGSSGWTPGWQPYFNQALATFKNLPGNQLEILMNIAYNAGYYNSLFTNNVAGSANSTASTVQAYNSFTNAWAGDSYHQYPYQVRGYLDQLYDIPTPNSTDLNEIITPANHVAFTMEMLSQVFGNVFQTLAYVDGSGNYDFITATQATTAFDSALNSAGLSATDTLDLSKAADRARIFALIDAAITNLETTLQMSFSATTTKQL